MIKLAEFLATILTILTFVSNSTNITSINLENAILSKFVEQRVGLNTSRGVKQNVVTQFTPLYNLDGELTNYYIEINENSYYIVELQTFTPVEFNLDSAGPYSGYNDSVCIYLGPLNYGALDVDNNSYLDLVFNEEYELEDSFSFNTETTSASTLSLGLIDDTVLVTLAIDDLIMNSTIISSLNNLTRANNRPYNNRGICGYVGAAIALYYSKYQFNNNLIASKYIETVKEGTRFTAEFVDHLVQIGANNGVGTSTTALSIKKVMEKYTDEINVKAGHYAMLLSTPRNIRSALNDNYPCVLFGSFVDPADPNHPRSNHAVTCYGIRTETLNTGVTKTYFVAHYGFSSANGAYSKVYLLDSLAVNPVGSYYNLYF